MRRAPGRTRSSDPRPTPAAACAGTGTHGLRTLPARAFSKDVAPDSQPVAALGGEFRAGDAVTSALHDHHVSTEEPSPGERVVVAMSGGVDSSVAAALLVERGYEVVGISLRLASEHARGRSSGCCSIEDFRDAGRVAAKLGIAHYVFDMREDFGRTVIAPFVEEYLAGRTPSPCILCNREIKFGRLRRKAAELGARFVATGHYARRELRDGRYRLLRGRDPSKDQSYFLFEMGQGELASTLFPVGDLSKDEVRRVAARAELPVAGKAESQEICFVPDGRYADFVERVAAARVRNGAIRDEAGNVLGRHGGVQRYTVGQRRGLGVAASEPLYVSAIDATSATVTVTPRSALARDGLVADGVVWTSGSPEPDGARVGVKIRYRHAATDASLSTRHDGSVRVELAEPQEGVSPGQAAVFYRGNEVVGGGWIRETFARNGAGNGIGKDSPCA
jgi:tRNA-specific 2-thiouridylase